MEAAIAVTAVFLSVEGFAYLWAARVLSHRVVVEEYRFAWWGFLGWWIGTAFSSLATVVRHVLFAAGDDGAVIHETLLDVALATSFAGTAGLLVYLWTLLQGPRRWHLAWYAMAVVLLVQSMAVISTARPIGAIAQGATLGMAYEQPLSGWIALAALPNVLLPLVLLAIIAMRSRGTGAVGSRTRKMTGLLALWIITKSTLTGGAIGLAPAGVTWAVRLFAIVVALALATVAVDPDRFRDAREQA